MAYRKKMVSSLNITFDLGFCHKVKQQNHYLNTVAKVPRNFADMKTVSLILVNNFLFLSICGGNYDLGFCTCWFSTLMQDGLNYARSEKK
jgi:hypothetical protein